MAQNKRLLEAWHNGVPLHDAWWTFAESQKKDLFISLESEGLHLHMLQSLKYELLDCLYTGKLYAFGVEGQSDSGPTRIPPHHFLRAAKIDWDRDYVASVDKEFHNVTVQSEREQTVRALTETQPADLGVVDPELERVPQPPVDPPPAKPRGRPDLPLRFSSTGI
jgi:hypothetical protein